MKRTLSIPAVVLVAVVALVLGSFGTATAAGLTTKQVKKIAAKVVAKKSSGLSVARAASADVATNATNLGGQPPSAYRDDVSVYTVDVASTQIFDAVIPSITAGRSYQISYSALLFGAPPGASQCFVYQRDLATGQSVSTASQSTTSSSVSGPQLSGVGVVTGAAGSQTMLRCSAAGAFFSNPVNPIQIVVTPLDSVTAGSLVGR